MNEVWLASCCKCQITDYHWNLSGYRHQQCQYHCYRHRHYQGHRRRLYRRHSHRRHQHPPQSLSKTLIISNATTMITSITTSHNTAPNMTTLCTLVIAITAIITPPPLSSLSSFPSPSPPYRQHHCSNNHHHIRYLYYAYCPDRHYRHCHHHHRHSATNCVLSGHNMPNPAVITIFGKAKKDYCGKNCHQTCDKSMKWQSYLDEYQYILSFDYL